MKDPLYLTIRKYRVFPILFSFFYIMIMFESFAWYVSLPDPTNGQSGFASAIVAAGAAWFKFYVESGNELYD